MIKSLKRKINVSIFIIALLLGSSFCLMFDQNNPTFTSQYRDNDIYITNRYLSSSVSGLNQSSIDELLDEKLNDYNQYGHFQEYYTPSIRDTYFALYVLETIGKLDQIDNSSILDYIIDHYNVAINEFQDDYSLRFYDLRDSEAYYQNSPLLTYCYAVLSLLILDELDFLVQSDIVDYIWSCFDSEIGGFFGYPSADRSPQNVSTAENIFFAVKVLNEIGINWNNYDTQKYQIISFLDSLQIQSPFNTYTHGEFNNDLEDLVDTVVRYDPNLRSAFFAITTLDSFDIIDSINNANFLQYIGGLYDSVSGCFFYNYYNRINRVYNIIGTSYGIELADLVGYTYDDMLSLNCLLNARMSSGGWGNSEFVGNYELIDTYEVIRYFKRNNKISYLDDEVKEEIFQFILRFQPISGFSSLSKDHTSLEVIWNTVSAFDLSYRISDLNLQELYDIVASAHKNYTFGDLGEGTWYGPATTNLSSVNYRTAPLEYKNTQDHDYSSEIGFLHSTEHIFYALSVLRDLFKLDDFSSDNNLTELLEHLVDCQFLEASYERYGGFLPDYQFTIYPPEYYEDYIYLRYTYFAIRSIEILDTLLFDGDISNNGIDTSAIDSFISDRLIETFDSLYYIPYYSDEIEDIIENTYFMVYVLKALDIYNLETTKIMNYINDNIDYTNFKNIYYLFSLSRLLNYSLNLNTDSFRSLLHNLYIEDEREFFDSYDSEIPNTNMVFWICDIALNDEIRFDYVIDNIATLGYKFHIEARLCNLIMDDFGSTATVKFESDVLETITLERDGGFYWKDVYLDLSPEFLPKITGYLNMYDGIERIISRPVTIDTYTEIISSSDYINSTEELEANFQYTIQTESGYTLLEGSSMYLNVYLNNSMKERLSSSCYSEGYYTCHYITYNNFTDWGEYRFDFYIIHPFLNPDQYDMEIGKKEMSLILYYPNMSAIVDTNSTDIVDNDNTNSTDESEDDLEEDNSGDDLEIDLIPISFVFILSVGVMSSSIIIKKSSMKYKKKSNS